MKLLQVILPVIIMLIIGTRQTAKEVIKGILSTPVLLAVLTGVVLSVTGVGSPCTCILQDIRGNLC